MLLPIALINTEHAEGGAPVFQASIKVLSEDISRAEQRPMDIMVNDEGRVYILYQTFESFFWDVYLVHSDDDGITWSEPVRVDDALRDGNDTNDESSQMEPAMALGPDGTIHVVWEDRRGYKEKDQLFTEPVRIRYSSSANGIDFTPSVEITRPKTINTWHAYKPDIAVNGDGDLVCVWEDKNQAGAYKNIWSSYSTDDGGSWSVPILVNTDGKNLRNHFYPRVAMFGDDAYVTWHDGRNETSGVKPYLAISRDTGETFQEEFPLSTDTAGDVERDYAYPVVDDAGNLYIAWHDRRTETDEIFFTRSEDNGNTFSQDNRLYILPQEVSDLYPHLHASGNGNISLVWERWKPFTHNMGTLYESDILYMNSSDGGRSWSRKLMIDDMNRYNDDKKDQRWVFSTFNNEGRALCVWMDSREEVIGANDFDIYFSRHSRSLSEINDLPVILDTGFLGEFKFDPMIGNSSTIFNFTFTYKDEQNDGPAEGYPRIQLYKDITATDPVFGDWVVLERTKGDSDFYFIDGVEYMTEITIPEEGDFYYRIQINDGVDPGIVSTSVIKGPCIDLTMPVVEMTGPTEMEWIASEKVRCSAIITDTGGAGVKNVSIGYRKSVTGPENFGGIEKASGFTRIDDNSYEAWAMVDLDPGTENYVRFVAKDRVDNGYAESEPINLWIDFDAPYSTDPLPKKKDVQIYPVVNCSVIWRDNNPGSTLFNFTGLDPSTIRYAYRTTSGDYSEWLEPAGYTATGPESYRSWAYVEFPDEGLFNFIKWQASDLVGNIGESPAYSVTVDVPENYKPVLTGKGYPGIVSSPTPHLWWDDAYDEEGDSLTYRVMLLKYPSELILMNWVDLGPRTFYDIPDEEALDPNFYILRINVTDGIGGWDILDHVFRIIDTGTPPPEMVPEPDPYYLRSPTTITWDGSPDDSETMSYLIRIGSRVGHGDILEWEDLGHSLEYDLVQLGLDYGIYSLQIMCFDGNNYSRVSYGLIKISDYRLDTSHPESHIAYRGVDGIRITDPLICSITNNGTFGDNVTVRITGELVEEGYAFLNSSGSDSDTYFVEASRLSADEVFFRFSVSIQPEEDARTGKYELSYTILSEDGVTEISSGTIEVRVRSPPDRSGGESIADDLSDLITDIFPFLAGLPTGVIIGLFIIIIVGIITGLVFIGISFAKRSVKKKRDPFEEQKRVYKEIYGREPTKEELDAMKGGKDEEDGTIDDFIKGDETTPEEQEVEDGPEEKDELPVATETGQTIPVDKVEPETSSGDKETDDLLDRLFD